MVWTTAHDEQTTSVAFTRIHFNRWVSPCIPWAAIFDTSRPRQVCSENLTHIILNAAIDISQGPFFSMISDRCSGSNHIRASKTGGHVTSQYRGLLASTFR